MRMKTTENEMVVGPQMLESFADYVCSYLARPVLLQYTADAKFDFTTVGLEFFAFLYAVYSLVCQQKKVYDFIGEYWTACKPVSKVFKCILQSKVSNSCLPIYIRSKQLL